MHGVTKLKYRYFTPDFISNDQDLRFRVRAKLHIPLESDQILIEFEDPDQPFNVDLVTLHNFTLETQSELKVENIRKYTENDPSDVLVYYHDAGQ